VGGCRAYNAVQVPATAMAELAEDEEEENGAQQGRPRPRLRLLGEGALNQRGAWEGANRSRPGTSRPRLGGSSGGGGGSAMAAARRRTASRAQGAPRRGHGPCGLQGRAWSAARRELQTAHGRLLQGREHRRGCTPGPRVLASGKRQFEGERGGACDVQQGGCAQAAGRACAGGGGWARVGVEGGAEVGHTGWAGWAEGERDHGLLYSFLLF
jgi:hypothetical protein